MNSQTWTNTVSKSNYFEEQKKNRHFEAKNQLAIFILYWVVHVRRCRRRHEQLNSHIHTRTHVQNVVRCYLSWRLDGSVAMIQWFDIWSGCKRSSIFQHNNIRCNHIILDWMLWLNPVGKSVIFSTRFKNVAIPSYNRKMWIEIFDSKFRICHKRIHFIINVAKWVAPSLVCLFW